MKCKICGSRLNNEQTKTNNPKSLCGFCDGSMLQLIIDEGLVG